MITPAPWDRFARWLPLAILVFCCQAVAEIDVTLSVHPVFAGYIKPGIPTELGIRLLASQGSSGRLTIRGSRSVLSTDIMFEAGVPLELHLPVAHDSTEPVSVELEIEGQLIHRELLTLQVVPISARVAAVVGHNAPFAGPTATLVHTSANELPLTSQAFSLLSALLLPQSALQALSASQRAALAEYAAGCGPLYLAGPAAPETEELQNKAGCGAQYLRVLPSWPVDVIPASSANLMPEQAALSQLTSTRNDPVLRSLAVFLGGYLLVLLLGARSATTARALLALPLAATALALLSWTLAGPRVQLVSWAEMDSGDSSARFTSLLQVTGMSRGEFLLGLPARLGLPAPGDPGPVTEAELDPSGQYINLRLQTHLMSRHAFTLAGVSPGTALAVQDTDNAVRVTNGGEFPSAAGILAWRGQRYTVPVLKGGQEWQPQGQPEVWSQAPPEQLLRQRASDGSSWMLLPHNIPALGVLATEPDSSAWILVRGTRDA